GALSGTVLVGRAVSAGHDVLYLVIQRLLHNGRMESVGDGPFLPGVADCDVLLAALAAFPEMCPLVPDDLPDIGGVAEDGRHAVSGEGAGPVWACPHGVDLIGHGDAAAATGIELVHETDKFGLRLIDLQGRTAVDGHLSVAV